MTRSKDAFSLIEVMVAIMVLSVALFGTMSALGLGSQLRETSHETELATRAIQDQIELYRGMASPLNVVDNIRSGVAPTGGADFNNTVRIPQLTFQNSVVAATVAVLNEAQASAAFPSDVDKDGDIDAADQYDLDRDGTPGEVVSTLVEQQGYQIVALRLILSWRTVNGDTRTMTVETMIYPKTAS